MTRSRPCIPPQPDPSCYRAGATQPPAALPTALEEAEHAAILKTAQMDAETAAMRFERMVHPTVIAAIARADKGSRAANGNASTIPPRPRVGSVRRGSDNND